MNKFDDGGPAFPHVSESMKSIETGDLRHVGSSGMSLRDWFAGMALTYLQGGDFARCESLAFRAYEIADAMLDVRSKTTPE